MFSTFNCASSAVPFKCLIVHTNTIRENNHIVSVCKNIKIC